MSNKWTPPPPPPMAGGTTSNRSFTPPAPPTQIGDPALGVLGDDEALSILDSTLLPVHRHDPTVLAFIAHYVRCRDLKEAARLAGATPSSGSHLRARPDVNACIQALTDRSLLKYGFDASDVVERVKEVASVDPIEFMRLDGTYKTSLHEIEPAARRAIKRFKAKNFYEKDENGVDRLAGQIIEVELWDKMKAVDLLGREKQIFKETKKVEHDVSKDMRSLLLESVDRAQARLTSPRDVTPDEDTNV